MGKKTETDLTITGDIKSEDDLKKVLSYLDGQGFSNNISYCKLHDRKIDNIINKSNKLSISVDNKFEESLKKVKNYDEARKLADEHFNKFNPDDKIFELLNHFYLSQTASCRTPSNRPGNKDISEWVKFKEKFSLKDEFGKMDTITVYDLTQKQIKVNYKQYGDYDFKNLYRLVYKKEAEMFDSDRTGIWYNLGEIEIKFFMNGSVAMKGNIKPLKKYYYEYIVS